MPSQIGFAMVVCLLLGGCFNSQAMIEARRKVAILARLEEVDLGKFRLTLPQPFETNEMAEIQFHAFGQVANRDLDQVTEALEDYGPELRHQLLLAARQLEMKDIESARLEALRTQIAKVINETLPGEPLQSVGFYQFGYYNF
ncbi:MAG: flagellar basal body-associated FliL family protein [Planctomycetota bacterium]